MVETGNTKCQQKLVRSSKILRFHLEVHSQSHYSIVGFRSLELMTEECAARTKGSFYESFPTFALASGKKLYHRRGSNENLVDSTSTVLLQKSATMPPRRSGRDGCCYKVQASNVKSLYSDDEEEETVPACRCCLSNSLLETMNIAIVGSGLAGLSAAISLEQVGYKNITIYERDVSWSARREGYGMTLSYDPRGCLEALGVLDDVANSDCPSRSHYLFDPKGNVKGYFGNAFRNLLNDDNPSSKPHRGVGQRGNLRVPRQVVRKILTDKLKYSQVLWNHKLLDVVQCEGDKVELVFDSPDENSCEKRTTKKRYLADIVIAADGIRSSVVRSWIPKVPPPSSLKVRLIVGISEGYMHPLLDERAFHTHTTGIRLFTMPFEGSRLDSVEKRRCMWQLTFSEQILNHTSDSEDSYTSEDLLRQALQIAGDWHCPIPQMIKATPINTIWGTTLCDRDPVPVYRELKEMALQRVLIIGDALHAMSPFKGQGANNALSDGRVVAQWLDPNNPRKKHKTRKIEKAVKSCMRELTQRTQKVVYLSREASKFWHSTKHDDLTQLDSDIVDYEGHDHPNQLAVEENTPLSAEEKEQQEEYQQYVDFAGVPTHNIPLLTKLLSENNIRAGVCDDLDNAVCQIILEHDLQDKEDKRIIDKASADPAAVAKWEEQVWKAIKQEDLGLLRRLSWEGQQSSRQLRDCRDSVGNSPLHIAVQTCQNNNLITWLVREIGCKVESPNNQGQTSLDLCLQDDQRSLLKQLIELNDIY